MATKTVKHHRTIAGEQNAAKIMKAIKEQNGEATVVTLGVQPSFMTRMLKADLVKISGKVKKPQRGRPAHMYRLTDKGRRLAAKAS
jgi:DNA-binding PadR family transcriptional regulator